jgi:hypothetical protein
MVRTIAGTLVVFAVVALLPVGFVRADTPPSDPATPKWLREKLPQGARLCWIEHTASGRTSLDGTDCRIVSRQPAIYEADLDGDKGLETVVLYRLGDTFASVYVAVLSSERRPERKQLIQTFAIGGYIQSHGGRAGIWLRDIDGDGKVEACFAGAQSASCGSRLKMLWHEGKSKDAPYQFAEAGPNFSNIEPVKRGFRTAFRDDPRWTLVTIDRHDDGTLNFNIMPDGPKREPVW